MECQHLVLDEDNALIGTSEDDEEQSALYISYRSDFCKCYALQYNFGIYCKKIPFVMLEVNIVPFRNIIASYEHSLLGNTLPLDFLAKVNIVPFGLEPNLRNFLIVENDGILRFS